MTNLRAMKSGLGVTCRPLRRRGSMDTFSSHATAEVENPVTHKPVILQKTLELDFNIPGQAVGVDPRCTLTATKWVMK